MSLRPINRIKHVRDAQFGIVAGTANTQEIIITGDNPTLGATNENQTGSTVNGIYLKVETTRTGTSSDVLGNFYLMIMKNPGGNLTFPNANVVGASDNKRYVIHQEMIMLSGQQFGPPRTVFNGVIKIPKGYRRNAPDDRLQMQSFSPGVACNVCMQAHYKEFR